MDVPKRMFFVRLAPAASNDNVSDAPPLDVIQIAGIPIFSASKIKSRDLRGEFPRRSSPISRLFVISALHVSLALNFS